MADMATCENRIAKVEKKAKTTKDKESVFEYEILSRIHEALSKSENIRSLEFTETEAEYVKTMNFLTAKPVTSEEFCDRCGKTARDNMMFKNCYIKS